MAYGDPMTVSSPHPNDPGWLTKLSTDSQETAAYTMPGPKTMTRPLAHWNYQSPTIVATMLKREVPTDGHVLDAGCGTGLSGRALHAAGFRLQQVPLPLETGTFAAVQCVGVLTYIPDTAAVMREFCRVVQSGGLVAFTQREDLFNERDVARVMQTLADEGVWTPVSASEPRVYLPGNADFADTVKVIYCVCRGV